MANFSVTSGTLQLLRQFEGLSLTAYWDVKRYSIGYGSGTLINGAAVKGTDRITQEEAEQLLLRDATNTAAVVNRAVTSAINQNNFDALVSFAYNVGSGNFLSSTLLKVVNATPAAFEAIQAEFNRWVFADGQKLAALVSRRQQEAYSYAQGTFSKPTNVLLIVGVLVALYFLSDKKIG